MLPYLEELDIAFIEQPVAPGDPRWLARVRAAARAPIIADESLSTSADALSLIANDAADVFSIYVGMGGGIREGVAVATIADAARLQCTIGSNLELGIAQAAMIHLAISQTAIRPEAIPCDIISRFFYEQDIVQEPLPVEAGIAYRIDKPGLGVELDIEAIERYRVA
jgi:muconate cycloisomerase